MNFRFLVLLVALSYIFVSSLGSQRGKLYGGVDPSLYPSGKSSENHPLGIRMAVASDCLVARGLGKNNALEIQMTNVG